MFLSQLSTLALLVSRVGGADDVEISIVLLALFSPHNLEYEALVIKLPRGFEVGTK